MFSCSDSPGVFQINQDRYSGSSQDGLIIQCTYVASGTEVEFTFDAVTTSATWHLYAFSNREAVSYGPERGSCHGSCSFPTLR